MTLTRFILCAIGHTGARKARRARQAAESHAAAILGYRQRKELEAACGEML